MSYSTYLGGEGDDYIDSSVNADTGAVYLGGETSSSTFPAADEITRIGDGGGGTDGFVAKISSSGDLEWITLIGGSGRDAIVSVDLDARGRVLFGGWTRSGDFPVKREVQAQNGGGSCVERDEDCALDGMIGVLSPDGERLLMGSYIGGARSDRVTGVKEKSGTLWVTGFGTSTRFQIDLKNRRAGGADLFVLRIDRNRSSLIGGRFLGGRKGETWPMIVIRGRRIYIVGTTTSKKLLGIPVGYASARRQEANAVAIKLDDAGRPVRQAIFGSPGSETASGGAIAGRGLWVGGWSDSPLLPMRNAAQPVFGGILDAYLVRLSRNLRHMTRSTYIGGSDRDIAGEIVTLSGGGVAIVGDTASADFPLVEPVDDQLESPGCAGGTSDCTDGFVTSMNGNRFSFSTYLGGSGYDRASSSQTHEGSLLVGGYTSSTDFPVQDAAQTLRLGGIDGFFVRISN